MKSRKKAPKLHTFRRGHGNRLDTLSTERLKKMLTIYQQEKGKSGYSAIDKERRSAVRKIQKILKQRRRDDHE